MGGINVSSEGIKFHNGFLKQYLIIILGLSVIFVDGKVYNTEDSIVLEGNASPQPRQRPHQRPRLPGPSIFEYRQETMFPQSSSLIPTEITTDSDSSKVKRGHEDKSDIPPEHPLYYEMAGDQLYVFEPSPMGAAPFMDAFISQQQKSQQDEANVQQNHAPRPNVVIKTVSDHPNHQHQDQPPSFNFDSVKIEQVTPRDAVTTSFGRDFASSPGDWDDSESNPSENSNGDEGGGDECITANEKNGQCVPFNLCYPVVFNSVTGELRNHGLAKILYQASGPCTKNQSWTLQTISIQVQPGVTSNVPLGIPHDFFNHTVCCPGYFYFENTIPHHFTQEKKRTTTKLKLKPSHPDPMLTPQQEGRSSDPIIQHHPQPYHRHRHHPHHNHPLAIQLSLPPPPILMHPQEMFQSDIMQDSMGEQDPDYYYFNESDDDFDSSYYTTRPTTTTTTSTSTSTPPSLSTWRPRLRQKIKKVPSINANNTESRSKRVETFSNSTDGTNNGAESTRSEIKVDIEGNINAINTSTNATTTFNKSTPSKKTLEDKSKENSDQKNHKSVPKRAEPLSPVVVSPPHLSAWNCPGRQMGMPRGHWPWMVALLNEGSHFCSGSLIDHRHILTSASCVADFQGKDIGKMRAILGDRVLYSSVDGPHVWRKILRITRHLKYNSESMEHDIAILEMENAVTYTPNIQPINLPSSSNKGHTEKAIVSGWSGADLGKRFFSARPTVDAIVEFMDREECHKQYDGFKLDKAPDDIICTKPTTTSCKADLGAPLMMKTGNCWHIIGILSHGLGCGMFPEIYTDTLPHLGWIQKNIRQHLLKQDTFLET